MTSTLQQEGGRKLGFSSERTMRTAQRLYENGFITYMRTDSTTLGQTALDAARSQARELYGDEYVPPAPRQYTRKVKNAQEAHEAIRPAGEQFRTPGQVAGQMGADEFRLYELIWQRTIASQMVDARGLTLSLRITAPLNDAGGFGNEALFTASGRTITFPGFLRAYVETVDAEAGGEADDAERRLPNLRVDEQLDVKELTPGSHSTSPPARYTEPSLIKALEELGIGRPSTYTSIIRTITERGYAWRKGQALVPSWIAFAVIGLLEQHFSRLVDYDFTAAMEDELDAIAEGRLGRTAWLSTFYFGGETGPEGSVSRSGGLKKLVGERLEEIDAREVNSLPLLVDSQGRQVTVRVGRYGPYLERPALLSGVEPPADDAPQTERANLPEDLAPDEVTAEVAEALFEQAEIGDNELGPDPVTGNMIVAKDGRYGPYVTEVLPEDPAAPAKKTGKNAIKPRTASLFKSMSLETIDLAAALRLLTLPRVVGTDPATSEEITAQNGRYGPYLRKGTDSRSIESEEALFTVTLEEALALYAQPKTRGRQAAAAAALREVGTDPVSGKPMVIKDGRFGPYVTDGETNASLRKGDEVETISVDRSAELLAERRARGPAPKRAAAKKPVAKKPAVKKSAATKSAAVKKPAAKKSAPAKTAATTASGSTRTAARSTTARARTPGATLVLPWSRWPALSGCRAVGLRSHHGITRRLGTGADVRRRPGRVRRPRRAGGPAFAVRKPKNGFFSGRPFRPSDGRSGSDAAIAGPGCRPGSAKARCGAECRRSTAPTAARFRHRSRRYAPSGVVAQRARSRLCTTWPARPSFDLCVSAGGRGAAVRPASGGRRGIRFPASSGESAAAACLSSAEPGAGTGAGRTPADAAGPLAAPQLGGSQFAGPQLVGTTQWLRPGPDYPDRSNEANHPGQEGIERMGRPGLSRDHLVRHRCRAEDHCGSHRVSAAQMSSLRFQPAIRR